MWVTGRIAARGVAPMLDPPKTRISCEDSTNRAYPQYHHHNRSHADTTRESIFKCHLDIPGLGLPLARFDSWL